jgi:hypothetical protein
MSRFMFVTMMLAVTVAGCDRFPDNGLQIAALLPPDDGCFVSADQEIRLLRGTYDLNISSDYVIAALVQSFLISNALEFQGEQANLQVDNFDITMLLPDGSLLALPDGLVNPYRVTTNAVLPAIEEGGDPSLEVAFAVGIPASYQAALSALIAAGQPSILLEIRAGGTTFGGFSQRSAPFRWPVDLCEGCLGIVCTIGDMENLCLPGQDRQPYCASFVPAPP